MEINSASIVRWGYARELMKHLDSSQEEIQSKITVKLVRAIVYFADVGKRYHVVEYTAHYADHPQYQLATFFVDGFTTMRNVSVVAEIEVLPNSDTIPASTFEVELRDGGDAKVFDDYLPVPGQHIDYANWEVVKNDIRLTFHR